MGTASLIDEAEKFARQAQQLLVVQRERVRLRVRRVVWLVAGLCVALLVAAIMVVSACLQLVSGMHGALQAGLDLPSWAASIATAGALVLGLVAVAGWRRWRAATAAIRRLDQLRQAAE